MQINPDAIFEAASQLPEQERWDLVSKLLEGMPPPPTGISVDDDDFIDELNRRFANFKDGVTWDELEAEG